MTMLYYSDQMEEQALLQTAAQMCAAARTAPKATGKDVIYTMVITGEEKAALVAKMREFGERNFPNKGVAWYERDAYNVHRSQAVVLIGAKRSYRGISHCGYCGNKDCAACKEAGGTCVFASIDLGIAISSAVSIAADARIDTRIMMSIGKAAEEMRYLDEDILWMGIPLSISGKSIFFDRNPDPSKRDWT